MKRLILFVTLMITMTMVYGQKSIDALFEEYTGRDGFVTIIVNGNLLRLVAILDDDFEDNSMPVDITEIRILVQEDEDLMIDNFYDKVINDINIDDYEEFMRVKESDQEMRMLVRAEDNRFKEFLLVTGGEDNALIQIKGNMTYDEAKRFSRHAKHNHGLNLVSNYK